MMRLPLALVVSVLMPASLWAAEALPKGGPITCDVPFGAKESAKTLKKRFGKDAVIKTVPGAEGEDTKALVLYPQDKKNELVITFFDDAMTKLSGVSPGEEATGWTVAGLKVGASLADVQKANGKPFDVAGFDWDYGGFVTNWHGGALDTMKGQGCSITLRFSTNDPNLPQNMSGDGVTIKSTDPRLAKAKPLVTDLSIGFAAK